MDDREREIANTIMNTLRSHPITSDLSHPLIGTRLVEEDYEQIIKRPMDLATVQEALDAGTLTFKKWRQDVELIFTNTEKYFGPGTLMSKMATETRRIFRRELKRYELKTWCEEVYRLMSKLYTQATETASIRSATEMINSNIPISKQLMDFDDMKWLVLAADKLNSREDQEATIEIIRRYQPEIVATPKPFVVDLSKLRPQTAAVLRDFFQKRLEDEGYII